MMDKEAIAVFEKIKKISEKALAELKEEEEKEIKINKEFEKKIASMKSVNSKSEFGLGSAADQMREALKNKANRSSVAKKYAIDVSNECSKIVMKY